MSFVIAAPDQASLPVAGSADRFPVRRIYCIGRNYADHAREMGGSPDREPPFFFCKPADAAFAVTGEAPVGWPYPTITTDLHHEIELVAAIGRGGRDIDVADALDHVWGYGVGLDMTRRDLQGQMKAQGRSWEIGKAFDHAAPISALRPASDTGHPAAGEIWLDVNGARRQSGDLSDMIWSVAEAVAGLSRYFELKPGDLLMTGTPAGVGAVSRGDVLSGGVAGVATLAVKIV
ncbi:fumarylacetoacetate hydrolase family protein [Denitromonas ohlonensis]|uniref:Fumarylacetoacetate hydrolase family protein n=2 Tax=Denitromonas TaxID=139331 RepID=A0A557S607_9RHOO|nr:fumarylacetoacetate hydrolase family protein [Denitromonas ohlonensis]TVO68785.1 fumarylacetoacetate hydrolase family protein [Denitromonas ohlonensis]TVO72849.1 fumarylacetoacetate hydrolase family protein [Denitromonas ohlonensis]